MASVAIADNANNRDGAAADRSFKTAATVASSLVPRPVVRRIGIDEGACGWQVYRR
jgi:hypothetical protein